MDYRYAWTNSDIKRIDKLNALTDKDTFWDDVRKMTRNVHSDHVIGIWQCLAEVRFNELIGKEEDEV